LPRGIDGNWPMAPSEEVHGTDKSFRARMTYYLSESALAMLARLPDRALEPVLAVLGRLAYHADRRHTQAARGFLGQAFGELSKAERERLVRAAYRHFLDVVVNSARLGRRPPGPALLNQVDVVGDKDAHAFFGAGRGGIVVTAHVGDWELGSALLPWLGLAPVYAVAKPPRNYFLSRAMLRSREARGIRVLPRRGAMAEAPAVFAAGGALALLLDQRARMKPVLAPFFGRPARCDRSAGVLVRRLKAPVLLAFCIRQPGRPRRYRVECGPVLWPADVSGWSPERFAERINQEFERTIRRHPEQYFWLHDRYRDTPLSFDPPGGDTETEAQPARSTAPPR